MSKFIDSTIGVTGASGNLGRHVVAHLRQAGARRIVAISRNPDKLGDLAGPGVELRAGSFDEPAGLAAAFAGVERLLIISTDTLADRAAQHIAGFDAALKAGVRHVAYTSIVSPYPDTHADAMVPNSHYWTEARIAASGIDFSILRNNLYTDFLLAGAHHAVASGTLYHAAGTGRRAYVTREDCAAAAAAALLDGEGKRIYDICGPVAISGDDLAAILAEISGKPVKAVNVPPEGFAAGLKQANLPPPVIGMLTRFETDAAKNYFAIVSGAFDELTGRKPRSVADFLAAHKSAIVA